MPRKRSKGGNLYLASHASKFWSLYHKQTRAEAALEPHLARLGRVYRFQHPLLGYFLDFAFLAERVAVEVDGESHTTKAGREKDAARDARMQKHGWLVIRLENETAITDPEKWVTDILIPTLESRNGITD